VRLKAEGAIELIGPKYVPLRGGMAGTYVKTKKHRGGTGTLMIKLDAPGKIRKEVVFKVKEGDSSNV
jgi:beta-galactosidase